LQHEILLLELMIGILELSGTLINAPFQVEIQLAKFLKQIRMTLFQLICPRGAPQYLQQVLGPERFIDVTIDLPAINGVDRILKLAVTGHEHANGLWKPFSGPLEQLHACYSRQGLVGQKKLGGFLRKDLLRFLGGSRRANIKLAANQLRNRGQNGWIIIDDQQ
jgi:hypothetical protein